MVEIIFKSLIYPKKNIWFFDENQIKLVDGNNLFFHAEKILENCTVQNLSKVYTTTIDLTKDIEEIKSNFKSKLRNYINKGEKINFEIKEVNLENRKTREELINRYNFFAKRKKIKLMDKQFFSKYCKSGKLYASEIVHEKKSVANHIYLLNEKRAFLMYSFYSESIDDYESQFRGTANRFLHWKDILFFKSKDFDIYDFGGISVIPNSLSSFKLSFGGIVEEKFSYMIPKGLYSLFTHLKSRNG